MPPTGDGRKGFGARQGGPVMPNSPLSVVAVAVLFGAAGQVMASLTRMPAIVFLLLLGVAAGPYGLGIVQPADLGAGLPVITSAFVAIILFGGWRRGER